MTRDFDTQRTGVWHCCCDNRMAGGPEMTELAGLATAQREGEGMHAVVITEPGEPEVLRWLEVPDPVPGPGEVVIDVVASGVNRADLLQREGRYPPPPGAPPYPGLECSGRVRSVGAGVTGWRPGDEVCALLAGGGYARAGRGARGTAAAGARPAWP